MKSFLSLILIFAYLLACNNKHDVPATKGEVKRNMALKTYELRGHIKGLTVPTLRLSKLVGNTVTDAEIEVTNERFNYVDSFEHAYFMILMIPGKLGLMNIGDSQIITEVGGRELAEFLAEPGIINIVGTAAKYDSIKVSGESNKLISQYLKEDEGLSGKWDQLKKTYDQVKKTTNTAETKKLGQQLNSIRNAKVTLLKTYVRDHRNTMVGALLPNFCTIQDLLKKEDYLEMYNSLSEEIKKTDYGQSVLTKAN